MVYEEVSEDVFHDSKIHGISIIAEPINFLSELIIDIDYINSWEKVCDGLFLISKAEIKFTEVGNLYLNIDWNNRKHNEDIYILNIQKTVINHEKKAKWMYEIHATNENLKIKFSASKLLFKQTSRVINIQNRQYLTKKERDGLQ